MRLNRRRFLMLAGAGAAGGVGLYTWRIEPHRLEIVRRPLPVRALPAALSGRTLVQISDVHVGRRVADLQNRRYTAGEFSLAGNRRLYVSRGVGHLLQVRFNVRPEVTVFELTPA